YHEMFDNLERLDGLVTLTERHRSDLATGYGDTDNLFVVPNPVVTPAAADPVPAREANRFTMVTRLEHQKRIGHALRAIARARESEPEATLDIYGSGSLLPTLQRRAAELGVADAVTFRGFDPGARDNLWTATAFLMTSRYEGYPLATLESMSHGCPVISYDLKYGPRDQILDGVDGFLVAEGDVR